jgi:hypothetical protein
MATILRKLKINRVSIVDRGAGEGVQIELFKRDPEKCIDHVVTPLVKAAEEPPASFDEALAETEGRAQAFQIMDSMFPLFDALQTSVREIYAELKGDDRKSKLKTSVNQFVRELKTRLTEIAKAQTKTEDGKDYPDAAYAYVPDASKPSTWKLRLWESPEVKETPRQVGMAVAALGPKGFRGQTVKIPVADLPKVKRRVRAAWKKVHDAGDKLPAILKGEEGQIDMTDDQFEELLNTVKTQGESITALTKRLNAASGQTDPPPDPANATVVDLEKVNTEVRADVKKTMDENASLRKEIDKLNHEQAVDREANRISTTYPNVSEDPRELAETLLKFDPDSRERKQFESLIDKNNRVVTGITSTLGVTAASEQGADAYQKLTKSAQEIAKRDSISLVEAFDVAKRENADAWAEYQTER